MIVADIALVLSRPRRGFGALAPEPRLLVAGAIVVGSGVLALGLSAAATLVEPGSAGRAAGLGISATLPVLFVAFWLIDALVIDAVAQLMGAPTRLRPFASASAHAIPLLLLYELVRLGQAGLDRSGAVDVSTAAGFLDFAVLGWFLALISVAVRIVYELPGISAFAAALAPPAAMGALLIALVILFSGLHAAGVG